MKKMTAILMGMMMLTTLPVLPANAIERPYMEELTVERSEMLAERYKSQYILGEDGVYYGSETYPIRIMEQLIPKAGTVNSISVLPALAMLHPDAKFAVDVQSAGGNVSYLDKDIRPLTDAHKAANGMTYSEFWDAWYAANDPYNQEKIEALKPYLSEVQTETDRLIAEEFLPIRTQKETDYLAQNGIVLQAADYETSGKWCILTAQQVLEFPGYESYGYYLGLAPRPENIPQDPTPIFGDVNSDGAIDIMDVILLNKYILGSQYLDDYQRKCADVNQDGLLDAGDALNILKYVVGNIDSFETVTNPDVPSDNHGYSNYADFVKEYEDKYEADPITIPEYEDYQFNVSWISLEKNRYKLLLKPFSPNLKYECPDDGYLVTVTIEFDGEYANYNKFLADYKKMSKKIENISGNHDFMLMDDDSLVLCGKLPDRDQVFIIDAVAKDNEEGRERLLRIAEKLGL